MLNQSHADLETPCDSIRQEIALALPGILTEQDAQKVKANGIELWELPRIAAIFEHQIKASHQEIEAFLEQLPQFDTIASKLLKELDQCPPGRPHWSIYQKWVGKMIQHLFCPPLNVPLSEIPDESGVNRRDFILANFAEHGFWQHMRSRYGADYIVIDAKNYSGKVKKKEVLQIANYLRPFGAGLFGLIISRHGGDNSAITTAREQWAHYQKMVVILNDEHVKAMLLAPTDDDATSVLTKAIQDFRLAM